MRYPRLLHKLAQFLNNITNICSSYSSIHKISNYPLIMSCILQISLLVQPMDLSYSTDINLALDSIGVDTVFAQARPTSEINSRIYFDLK